MALQPFCWTLAAFSVSWSFTDGKTPWTGDQPVARPLPTQRTTQTQNKRTQTSMPDSNPRSQCSSGRRQFAATVIGQGQIYLLQILNLIVAVTAGISHSTLQYRLYLNSFIAARKHKGRKDGKVCQRCTPSVFPKYVFQISAFYVPCLSYLKC
jgi:hypothetical protein